MIVFRRDSNSFSTMGKFDIMVVWVQEESALADMFSLPLLLIPQSPPARSSSPMAAISTSQSCCDKSCHSSSVPSIPATRPHSPEPELGPSKQPITWDLKDPAHPLYRWGMQQAYKKHIEQAGYDYPVPCSLLRSGGLKVRLAQVNCVGEFKGKGSGRVFGNDQR